ncbi:hypothetical protein FNI11_01100 [Salmonella enterica subsp. salamae]|nr:hypothetical protein [Salmonella enterica subsp. salamae]ECJ2279531.1 hypothetical protein [Salmonella enterica subsp. salamae]
MSDEKQKMIAGELYCPSDKTLCRDRLRARQLIHQYNHTAPGDIDKRQAILRSLLGRSDNVYTRHTSRCLCVGFLVHLSH